MCNSQGVHVHWQWLTSTILRDVRSSGQAAERNPPASLCCKSLRGTNPTALPTGEACHLESLIAPPPGGIASRILANAAGGSVTLFAFDAGQGLTEHSSPFDALVLVLAGTLDVTIADAPVEATPGTIVRLPAGVVHAVEARHPTRMLLVMLRDAAAV